ncbi:unnamed protein product [Medioppia subpectinata]|uniref:SUN domain-containing protein n=1 Tax=Medioppia subpectinata TaxID=1979941 RepID=A0A7R9PVH9_9ACAR|nr:unnamed protein product [Medioppia subpectinata]CAG2101818.1 unnamed protein product [Medioppia subpectinata]
MAYRRMTSQSAVICLLIVGHYMSANSSPSPSPSEPSVEPQVVTNASDDNAVPNTGADSSSVPSMPITGSADELSKTANTSSGSDGQNGGDHSAPVVNDSKQPVIDPNRLPDIPVVELPSVPTPAPPNEMLSFEEWRKKIAEKAVHQQLRQQQQQQQQQNGQLSAGVKATGAQGGGGGQQLGSQASGATGTGQTSPEVVNGGVPLKSKPMASPKRTRNFASHECGAKIVDSNPESESVLRILNEQTDEYMLNPCKAKIWFVVELILNEQTDEYMLNPCKAKIWFVVELCETVQPNHIELANFELYSSVPKEFNIQASDHYPTRDWSSLGMHISSARRAVRATLCLDANQLTAAGVEEEESPIAEEMLGGEESAHNLFGTARDAVFNIVRKAAQALNGCLTTDINFRNKRQQLYSLMISQYLSHGWKPIMDDWAAAPVSNAIDSSVPAFNSASIVDTGATFARSTPSSTSVMASHVLSGDSNDVQQLSTDDTAKGEPTVQTLSNDSSSSESSKSPPVTAEDILPIVSTNNETNGGSDESVNNITTGEGSVATSGTQINGQQVVATNGQNTAPVNGQPLNGNNNGNGYISNGATIGQTKESVVIRLSNRIKALEVNLSLSSQYLEQLSQRYRKQMEEMQKAFNITISKLNDTNIRAAERL